MSRDVAQRKFAVVVLAAVVVGLVAFVGACAVIDSTNWLSEAEFGDEITDDAFPPIPPHWSPDGTTIVLHRGRGSYLVDTGSDGTALRRTVVEGNREAIYPRISPDGSRMVFSTEPNEDFLGGSALGISNLDGSDYRRLLRNRGYQHSSEWSPDGTQIAFVYSYHVQKTRDDNSWYNQNFSNLYTMPIEGPARGYSASRFKLPISPGLLMARR